MGEEEIRADKSQANTADTRKRKKFLDKLLEGMNPYQRFWLAWWGMIHLVFIIYWIVDSITSIFR